MNTDTFSCGKVGAPGLISFWVGIKQDLATHHILQLQTGHHINCVPWVYDLHRWTAISAA